MPTNAQIDTWLAYLLDHSPVDLGQLSGEGRKLVQDTRDVINTTRSIVRDKNADELFQQFIWHTRDIERESLVPGDVNNRLPVDRQTATSDSQQGICLSPSLQSRRLTLFFLQQRATSVRCSVLS
jgi:hypothetical protein